MRTSGWGKWRGLVGLAVLTLGRLHAQTPADPAAPAEPLPPTMAQQCIACCDGPEPTDSNDPNLLSGIFFTGDYLIVMPRTGSSDFAVPVASRTALTGGNVESVRWTTANGFRIGGGYRLPDNGWDVGVLYTSFTAKDKGTATAPDGGALLPTLTQRGGINDVATDAATATIQYTTFDLEVGKTFRPDDSWRLRFFGDGRYASIDQGLKSTTTGDTLGKSIDDASSPVQFQGGGLAAGGECDWNFCRKWGLYGKARMSLVYGSFKTQFSEGIVDGASIASISQTQDKLIPIAEAGAGLFFQGEHAFFQVGYDLTNWFNMVNPLDFTSSVSPGHASRRESDLMFQGVSVKLGFAF